MRTLAPFISLSVSLALVAGCPGPSGDDTGGGELDTPAGLDAGADAGGPDVPVDDDLDDDGVPTGMDCNDMDPMIGTSGSRSCDGPCGPGVEACIAGMWRGCEASTDCLCAVEGMTRTMPCGTMCGTRTDTCRAMRWTMGATCDREGACMPDAVEMMDGRRCSVTRRTCQDDCTWGPTEVVVPEGECGPDYINCLTRDRCSATCMFERFTSDPRCM